MAKVRKYKKFIETTYNNEGELVTDRAYYVYHLYARQWEDSKSQLKKMAISEMVVDRRKNEFVKCRRTIEDLIDTNILTWIERD